MPNPHADPTSPVGALEQIRSDIAQGRFQPAADELTKAMRAHGDHLWLLVAGQELYSARGQHDEALRYAEAMITTYPDEYHGYARAAQELMQLQRYEDAATHLRNGVQRFPQDYWLLVIASDLWRELGQHETALSCAQSLIRHHGDQPIGYLHAGRHLLALGRPNEAQAQIAAGLNRFSDDPHLLTMAQQLYCCAVIDRIALKQFEEALATAEAGLRQIPQSLELQHVKAYASAFLNSAATSYHLEQLNRKVLSMRDMIAFSHLPRIFADLQTLRESTGRQAEPETLSELNGRSLLFITGHGRSGTSALCKMLNLCQQIEVYTELYDPARLNGYHPADFTAAALRQALARHAHPRDRDLFQARHEHSRWIGDKRPNFHFCMEATFDHASDSGLSMRTIYIQRDLRSVLRSTHHRSENADDHHWSLEHGMEYTMLLHNATLRLFLDLHQRRPDVFASMIFLRYDQIFGTRGAGVSLLETLGVNPTPAEQQALTQFLRCSTPYAQRPDPADALAERADRVINTYLDREAQAAFGAISGLPPAG
jgi:tetratricopeptide (TPR) repeat protein